MIKFFIKRKEQAPKSIVKKWLNKQKDDKEIFFMCAQKEWKFDNYSHFLKVFKPFGLPDINDQSSPYKKVSKLIISSNRTSQTFQRLLRVSLLVGLKTENEIN